MDLKDKVVLITGSSSGIGKAAALRFAKEGAKVVVNYKTDQKAADEVVREIREIAFAFQADVCSPDQVKKLFSETIKKFGTIDILINNAGLATPKPFLEITRDDLIAEFDKNFFSMVYSCQEAAKIMSNGGGKIINVTSIGAITGFTTVLTYSTAKAAVENMTKTLAKKLAPKITVNTVAPGYTLTRFWNKTSEEEKKELLDSTLLKKWVLPEDIVEAFIYLAKNDSVTGQTLIVDAGYMTTL